MPEFPESLVFLRSGKPRPAAGTIQTIDVCVAERRTRTARIERARREVAENPNLSLKRSPTRRRFSTSTTVTRARSRKRRAHGVLLTCCGDSSFAQTRGGDLRGKRPFFVRAAFSDIHTYIYIYLSNAVLLFQMVRVRGVVSLIAEFGFYMQDQAARTQRATRPFRVSTEETHDDASLERERERDCASDSHFFFFSTLISEETGCVVRDLRVHGLDVDRALVARSWLRGALSADFHTHAAPRVSAPFLRNLVLTQ